MEAMIMTRTTKGALALAASLLLAAAAQKTRAEWQPWVPAGQWCTDTRSDGAATITGWACSGSAYNCSNGTRTVAAGCSGNNCALPSQQWYMEGIGCPVQTNDTSKCVTVLSNGPTAKSQPSSKDLKWTTCSLVIPID
jgi:hypothetical protein